jgi:hypothetical protein
MKISASNTAIGLLDHCDPLSFRMCEDSEHTSQEYKTQVGLSVVREWPKVVDHFKQKVQYISDPFYQAYNRGVSKLASVIDAEDVNESGTFITRSSPSETNTIFYHLISEGKGSDFRLTSVIFFFTKHTSKDKPALAIIVQRNNKGFKEYLSDVAAKNNCTGMSVIADIFSLVLFMKYCEVQTKTINAGKKDTHVGTKYVNESLHNIEVLDSTWFTTIVRSEGFGVRGHFRMQPYGTGDKKLIWISDYEKSGYTRKAKILTHLESTQS